MGDLTRREVEDGGEPGNPLGEVGTPGDHGALASQPMTVAASPPLDVPLCAGCLEPVESFPVHDDLEQPWHGRCRDEDLA